VHRSGQELPQPQLRVRPQPARYSRNCIHSLLASTISEAHLLRVQSPSPCLAPHSTRTLLLISGRPIRNALACLPGTHRAEKKPGVWIARVAMAEDDSRPRLAPEPSNLSNISTTSTLVGALPSSSSPARQRATYSRLGSGLPENRYSTAQEEGVDIADTVRNIDGGLGIAAAQPLGSPKYGRRVAIQEPAARLPAGGSSGNSPRTDSSAPGSGNPMISPGFDFNHMSASETAYDPGQPFPEEDDEEDSRAPYKRSQSSFQSYSQPYNYSDTARLNKHRSFTAASIRSTKSAYETDFHPDACPTTESFYLGRFNWLAISILVLAIFSTVFSGIFLGIAIRAPRWGRAIHTGGSLSPSTANVLVQIFAKLIELS
jgi:hypothetical protein